MPLNTKPLINASRLGSLARQQFHTSPRAFYSSGARLPGGTPGESPHQAMPLGLYYEAVLNRPQPIPEVKPELPPTSSPKSPRSTVKKSPPPKKASPSPPSSSASASAPASGPETSSKPATAQEKSPRGPKSPTTAA